MIVTSEDVGVWIVATVFISAFVIAGVTAVRESRRDPTYFSHWARRMGWLIIKSLTLVVLAAVLLEVAFNYFEGWTQFWVIEGGIAVLVLFYYVIRWSRYPGIYQSTSAGRLALEIILGCLLFMVLPFLAVSHLAGALLPQGTLRRLGLEFKHGKYDRVLIAPEAPAQFRPGQYGRIESVKVVSLNDPRFSSEPSVGAVYYAVSLSGQPAIDVPEAYLIN